MFNGLLFSLAKDHDRALREAADRSRLGRGSLGSPEEATRRRAAGELRLLWARRPRG